MHMGIKRRLLRKALFAHFTNKWPVENEISPSDVRAHLLEPQMGGLDMAFDKLLFRRVLALDRFARFGCCPSTLPPSCRPIGC